MRTKGCNAIYVSVGQGRKINILLVKLLEHIITMDINKYKTNGYKYSLLPFIQGAAVV